MDLHLTEKEAGQVLAIKRDLHMHPELSFKEYETAAFDMKEGEVRRLDTSSGIVIIKKYSLDDITESIAAAIQNTIISERTTQLIDDYDSKFEINQQLLDSFNVVDMPIFSD